jgi:hypothetical protein
VIPDTSEWARIVADCVKRGWGATDEQKVMRTFKVSRAEATQILQAAEDRYVADIRRSKQIADYGRRAPRPSRPVRR